MEVELIPGRQRLRLAPTPFKQAGEGKLYHVLGMPTGPTQVAKLYHPTKRTAEQQHKLDFMVQNPPERVDSNGHPYLIWPQNLALEQGGFAGFVMPLATGESLDELCSEQLHRSLGPEWQRYSRTNPESKRLRLNIARNLAYAVAALQHKRNYVLGDLKPANIIVTTTGRVSVIDIDSVQVTDGSRLLFPCPVVVLQM